MADRFNSVKKGYDPTEVDAYIETMENVIKSYKEKDSSIKNAILNAQIAADSIVQNAKNQASEIRFSAISQMKDIKDSISIQKAMFAEFKDEYNRMMAKYLIKPEERDFAVITEKINAFETYLKDFEKPIDNTSNEN